MYFIISIILTTTMDSQSKAKKNHTNAINYFFLVIYKFFAVFSCIGLNIFIFFMIYLRCIYVDNAFLKKKSCLFIFGCSGSSLPLSGFLQLQCPGFSLQWLLLVVGLGSRHMHFGSCGIWTPCSTARGSFLEQGLNPYPLHWWADSQPLDRQGSPGNAFLQCESGCCV